MLACNQFLLNLYREKREYYLCRVVFFLNAIQFDCKQVFWTITFSLCFFITVPVFPIGQYHSCICRIDKEKFPDLNLYFLSHIRSVNREIKTYDPLIRAGSVKHSLIETKTSTEVLCKDRSFRQLCQKIQQDSKLNESGAHQTDLVGMVIMLVLSSPPNSS